MKSLMGVGSGKAPVFDKAAKTLTFLPPYDKLELKNLLLILNVTKNKIIYSEGAIDGDGHSLVGEVDYSTFTIGNFVADDYDEDDVFHVWVETGGGVAAMDFLSDLALRNQSYAALTTLDFTVTGENATVDFTFDPTQLETLTGQSRDATIDMKASIDKLLQVPDTFIIDRTGEAAIPDVNVSSYVPGIGGTNQFVSVKNISSTGENSAITLRLDGVVILSTYDLNAQNYLDIKFDSIDIPAEAILQITLLELL